MFVLSAHAKTVITERSFKMEWLEHVLTNPEKVEADRGDPDLRHALARIPEHGDRVVTVYFYRTLRNKL